MDHYTGVRTCYPTDLKRDGYHIIRFVNEDIRNSAMTRKGQPEVSLDLPGRLLRKPPNGYEVLEAAGNTARVHERRPKPQIRSV